VKAQLHKGQYRQLVWFIVPRKFVEKNKLGHCVTILKKVWIVHLTLISLGENCVSKNQHAASGSEGLGDLRNSGPRPQLRSPFLRPSTVVA